MNKENLDKFIEGLDKSISKMSIGDLIIAGYGLGRLDERNGVDKEERTVKDADICFLYCENYMECARMMKDRQTCGTFMVLKDRYGKGGKE